MHNPSRMYVDLVSTHANRPADIVARIQFTIQPLNFSPIFHLSPKYPFCAACCTATPNVNL
ncbi:hypothetical protein CW304_16260 [Bacillus sp. UFRGS-B20]|nr:hypothetical protein CW304_16260 [Bacillus sp. UFRGS-B20]